MELKTVTVVEILPTKIWIESGMMGERYVMIQHQDCEPFEYAVFNYNYMYTSNSGTWNAAEQLARSLGAQGEIEQKNRGFTVPTKDELKEQINILQEALDSLDD